MEDYLDYQNHHHRIEGKNTWNESLDPLNPGILESSTGGSHLKDRHIRHYVDKNP